MALDYFKGKSDKGMKGKETFHSSTNNDKKKKSLMPTTEGFKKLFGKNMK